MEQQESEWQGPMYRDCGSCNFVRRTYGRAWCVWCRDGIVEAARILARNLRDAGALCAAFWEGWDQREHHDLYSAHGYRTEQNWRPGCGRPTPGNGEHEAGRER